MRRPEFWKALTTADPRTYLALLLVLVIVVSLCQYIAWSNESAEIAAAEAKKSKKS
jgi:hypothetical protein